MTDGSPAGPSATKPAPQTKYDYSQGPPPVNINLGWCKACNLCIVLCPKQVFEPDRNAKPVLVRPENCTQCTICWVHCPDLAITSNYK